MQLGRRRVFTADESNEVVEDVDATLGGDVVSALLMIVQR